MASADSNRAFVILRFVIKLLAALVGAVGTVLCLMAVVGTFAQSGWIRFPVALVVAVVVPAVLADRLLPDAEDRKKAKGLVSDVFALSWIGFAVLFSLVAGTWTRPLLGAEGDRLTGAGWTSTAGLAYLMAGVQPEGEPAEAPADDASGSGSADPSAAASAGPSAAPSATSTASAAPSGTASATGEPDDEKDPDELTPAELFKKFAPAVVTIDVESARGRGGGTGFLLDDEGTIATNFHVIDQGKKVTIRFMSGATYEEVWVLVEDSTADLALLDIELDEPTDGKAPEVEAVELGDSEKVTVGERAISIGNPLGLEHTLTDGLVSARRMYEGKRWIQISTPISPGNSGGPLFNLRGEVIGVSTASIGSMFGRAQNLNLAVPINTLKDKLRAKYPGRRKFGTTGGKSSRW